MIPIRLFRSLAPRGAELSCFARSCPARLLSPLQRSGTLSAHAGTEKELLAPTGHLRVGVYPGSPTSMVVDPATKQTHGIAHDLGQEFADRLGVPIEYVTFQRVADIVTAIKNGEVDFTVTNATPARANDVSFSPPVIAIELGYLVPANSPITRPTRSIGRAFESASPRAAPRSARCLHNSRTRQSLPAESVKLAIGMLEPWRDRPLCHQQADAVRNVGCHAQRAHPGWQLGPRAHGRRYSQRTRARPAFRRDVRARRAIQWAIGAAREGRPDCVAR